MTLIDCIPIYYRAIYDNYLVTISDSLEEYGNSELAVAPFIEHSHLRPGSGYRILRVEDPARFGEQMLRLSLDEAEVADGRPGTRYAGGHAQGRRARAGGRAGQTVRGLHLLKALRYTNAHLQMPPTGKLPDTVIADFEKWIVPALRIRAKKPPAGGRRRDSAARDVGGGGPQMVGLPAGYREATPAVKDAAWAKTESIGSSWRSSKKKG